MRERECIQVGKVNGEALRCREDKRRLTGHEKKKIIETEKVLMRGRAAAGEVEGHHVLEMHALSLKVVVMVFVRSWHALQMFSECSEFSQIAKNKSLRRQVASKVFRT